MVIIKCKRNKKVFLTKHLRNTFEPNLSFKKKKITMKKLIHYNILKLEIRLLPKNLQMPITWQYILVNIQDSQINSKSGLVGHHLGEFAFETNWLSYPYGDI